MHSSAAPARPVPTQTVLLRWGMAAWLALAVFDATQTVLVMRIEGMHHDWGVLYLVRVLSWLAWALLTPLVLLLGRRFPLRRVRPVMNWVVHLVAIVLIDLGVAAWVAGLEYEFDPMLRPQPILSWLPFWLDHVYNGLFESAFLYAVVLGVGQIVASRERLAQHQVDTARLNAELSRAQLDALRRQIEPHFLFNALNSVVALIREQRNEAAETTLVALSEVLRRLVEDPPRHEVTLGAELQFLQQYLAIQKMRFADRLQVELAIASELLPARVPSLLLQPLVENAIKHGIAQRARGGRIRIAASRRAGRLELCVSNDGPALAPQRVDGSAGIGLVNVRTRLECLYHHEFELTLRDRDDGVEARVSLPYRAD